MTQKQTLPPLPTSSSALEDVEDAEFREEKKEKFYLRLDVIMGAVVLALLFTLLVFGFRAKYPTRVGISQKTAEVETQKIAKSTTAREVLDKKAYEWQKDAVLAYLDLETLNDTSASAIFTSPMFKNKGFRVEIKDGNVVEGEEIPYTSKNKGAPFPKKYINEDEAITRVKAMKGYEDASISTIEAVYEPQTKQWYWGITTTKGTVSFELGR